MSRTGRFSGAATPSAIIALARLRHAGARVVSPGPNAIAETRAALADPTVPAVFGATVPCEPAACRTHALVREPGPPGEPLGAGRARPGWRLEAVRASTKVKGHHRELLARQVAALRRAGVNVTSVVLLTLDRGYVFTGGALDPQRLFAVHELPVAVVAPTAPAREAGAVARGARRASQVPTATGPEAAPLTWLPGVGPADAERWLACGVGSLGDLGADGGDAALQAARIARGAHPRRGRVVGLPGPLSRRQRRALACHLGGARWVSSELAGALQRGVGPVHALDFETFAPPLPRWPNTAPYQAIPTQFSLHIDRVGAAATPPIHRDYVHTRDSDPRRALAEALLGAVAPAGAICVYSGFEARVIRGLATALPDLALPLRSLLDRLWDLHPVVRRHVVDPGFRGSTSLKRVAATLLDVDPYAALPVSDGHAAQPAFERALARAPGAGRDAEFAALRRYCAADSWALLAVWRALRGLAAASASR